MAAAIIQRCLATRPDLMPPSQTQLTIKRNAVGLRPCRKSGTRIEGEWMSVYTFLKDTTLAIFLIDFLLFSS